MGTIDSRRIDRPGIICMLRNKEVQGMWDAVFTHEFALSQAEQAFQVSATQECGRIPLSPHGKPGIQQVTSENECGFENRRGGP